MTVSLELAITAIRAKRRDEGRRMLNVLIQQNPNDEAAWLWMSEVVENEAQRVKCLQNVLTINPHNEMAHRGMERLGHQVNGQKPETKPVPANTSTEPKPEPAKPDLDPKTITKELPFTPLKEPFPTLTSENETEADTSAETETATVAEVQAEEALSTANTAEAEPESEPERKGELSDTKVRLRQLTAALVAKQTQPQQNEGNGVDSQPVSPNVPLPDFDSALQQINQTPIPPMMAYPSQPTPVIGTMQNGHSQPFRPDSVPFSPQMGYLSPSQPTRPINLNQWGLHPSQAISNPMLQQMNQPAHHYQATTLPMPMQNHPSTGIPVVQANSTIGATLPMPSYSHAHHANTTMGMPVAMPPRMDSTGYMPPQAGYPAPNGHPHKSDQELIAEWQHKNAHLLDDAYDDDEDDEEINIVMVIIFGVLTLTMFGGLGMLALIMVTTS